MPALFEPVRIGSLELTNRVIRSATWDGMADSQGPFGALDLQVSPIRGLLAVKFLPDILIAVDLGPTAPDLCGDLKGLHNTGCTHGVHAPD